jgi:hypothetical protein
VLVRVVGAGGGAEAGEPREGDHVPADTGAAGKAVAAGAAMEPADAHDGEEIDAAAPDDAAGAADERGDIILWEDYFCGTRPILCCHMCTQHF